ncbi:TonB system transport protein ExbD [Sphingomonas sp. OTU376]|uniref:TonB system transport protein ExbD n=1 Tax=Sphingomonas sp. OTU376 TaxID=3043863 RepID=UPI00313D90AE
MSIKLGSDSDEMDEINEINITPFIDVMLVLLIIFMIAAPLATVSVPLELPVSTAKAEPEQQDPIILSLQGNLKVSLGDRQIDRAVIGRELDRESRGNKQARIMLRADKGVPYGDLMRLMDDMRKAGYLKVGLVTEDSNEGAAG